MPVYEYECRDCGKQFEESQSIKDKPVESCKFCGGTVQKLISSTSFALKGGGWYQDGYSKPAPKKASAPKKTKDGGKKKTSNKNANKSK